MASHKKRRDICKFSLMILNGRASVG